jgi:hypothetical protein
VQYDLSYISKWLSGKMLPSEKNVDEVIENIISCILSSDQVKLAEEYGCKKEELENIMIADLKEAYEKSRPKTIMDRFQAVQSTADVMRLIDKKLADAKTIIAVLDIFSLAHENRLVLAGIKDGHFVKNTHADEYSMIISINSGDCVYDSIFLIHMLTSFSGINFNLYNNSLATGKLIYSVDDSTISAFVFPGNKDFIAVGELGDGKKIRQNISPFIDQQNLIFRKSKIQDMIENREYIQTMISTNIRWVLGHATELLLPQQVFEELIADQSNQAEYHRLYSLSQSILRNPATKVMIYESVMANLAVDGILDFYNQPVQLNPQQILCCLDYYMNLSEMGAEIKLIDGGFSDDFRYITNPCLFLSDSICYLRLENNRYEDNILLLNDRGVKELFDQFFDTVWMKREDVVTSEQELIREKMKHYHVSAEILNRA